MRAVMYEAPKTFAVVDVPTPEPGPKDVRVRVELAGICGTDVHIHDGTFFAQFPLIPGHEMVGVVDSVGESVDDLRLGIGSSSTGTPVARSATSAPKDIRCCAAVSRRSG